MLTRAYAPLQVRKKYLGAAVAVQTGAGQVLPAGRPDRVRSHCRFALLFVHLIPGLLRESVPLFLRGQPGTIYFSR